MRIGLNLLHAQPEIGGGWQYIENLVGALGEYGQVNEYVAFVTTLSECMVPKNCNIRIVPVNIRAKSRLQRIFYENTILQFFAKKYMLDCMHWFANTQAIVNTVPAVVTIYDLLVYHNSTIFPAIKRTYLRILIPLTIRRAARLLPMSRATATDLQMLLQVDQSRMVVIPMVLNDRFIPADRIAASEFRMRLGLPIEYWLYVAHYYPHKNHARLLQAYSKLKQSGEKPWPLVLRGDPHGGEALIMETIKKYNLSDDVLFVPELTNREMPLLYSNASALIFPSLFEGGGMPVAEAMACGCPVVGSDIPAVKEFASDAAICFDAKRIDSIVEAMLKCQKNPELRATMRRGGLDRANDMRPKVVVNKLLEVYAQVISTKERGHEKS